MKIQRNKYRRLKVGEVAKKGDFMNAISNLKTYGNLNTGGWIEITYDWRVMENDTLAYYTLKNPPVSNSNEQIPSESGV